MGMSWGRGSKSTSHTGLLTVHRHLTKHTTPAPSVWRLCPRSWSLPLALVARVRVPGLMTFFMLILRSLSTAPLLLPQHGIFNAVHPSTVKHEFIASLPSGTHVSGVRTVEAFPSGHLRKLQWEGWQIEWSLEGG